MSDTPRTDAMLPSMNSAKGGGRRQDFINLCRTLERDLAAANAKLAALQVEREEKERIAMERTVAEVKKLAAKPDVAGLVERLRNPRITFCSMDDAADALLSLSAQLAEKEAECAGLREVIYWALGERGPFPDRPEGWDKMQYTPWYWWRTELRQKLDAAIAARKP